MDDNIKNSFDFEYKVNFIIDNNNNNNAISNDLLEQKIITDSSTMNYNLSIIEEYINKLYEKIRILEEVMSYAQVYMQNEIDKTIKECKSLLIEIENMNINTFNNANKYTIINIPFTNNEQAQFLDRDGAQLKPCEPVNGLLSLSGAGIKYINIKDVNINSNLQVYERNSEALKINDIYRTHYITESLIDIGIIEKITFSFESPQIINNINFKFSNCHMNKIIYIYEDNTIEEKSIDELYSNVIAERNVKAIEVFILCNNHKRIRAVAPIRNQTSNYIDNININMDKNIAALSLKDAEINNTSKGIELSFVQNNNVTSDLIIDRDREYEKYINNQKTVLSLKNKI